MSVKPKSVKPGLFSVVIPAAGASQRLGQPKQLVQYKGKTLIQRAVETAASLAPVEVIVVTGANAEAVKDAVGKTYAQCVHNSNWGDGMGGSIAVGTQAVHASSEGLMILLCDQWRIEPEDLQLLVSMWQADPTRITCAETSGRYSPPVIFPQVCFQELGALNGDQGAHSILKTHGGLLNGVNIRHADVDLDTPSQLDEMKRAPQ